MPNYNQNHRGSILIWTVSVGMALTTAFFFLATRLGLSRDTQQASILYFSQKAYLESYVNYLVRPGQPRSAGTFTFDSMSAVMEQRDTIEGVLDAGRSSPAYSLAGSLGTVTVSWNKCGETGDIRINDDVKTHQTGPCIPGGYDDSFTINAVLPNSVTLTALNSPFHYQLSRSGTTDKFSDAKWQIDGEIPLKYGKKITIERVLP